MRALPIVALAFCGCGSADGPAVGWRGPTPHVSIHGGLDGDAIDLELGLSDAVNRAAASCAPPFVVAIRVPDGDAERHYELELAELSWTWQDPVEGVVGVEGPARSGAIEYAMVPDDDSPLLGLRFDAAWTGGALTGSVTVPCSPDQAPSSDHRSSLAADDSRARDRSVARGD